MLFILWEQYSHRPTRDVDLLFLNTDDLEKLGDIFRNVAAVPVPADGITFDASSVEIAEIRESNNYGGIRIKMVGHIGNTLIPMQVDIGLGDAVYSEPEWKQFTTLLEFHAPKNGPTTSKVRSVL